MKIKKNREESKKRLVILSILGYCLVMISFIGFFSYYLGSSDATSWQWIITVLAGSVLLAYKNKHTKNEKRINAGVFDLLYFLLLLLLAYLHLPYGLNFVLIAVLGSILIVPLLNYSLGAWKN